MEILINNISWIKDVFLVLFAGVATVLSILTYRKARHTILQPIRSEVIKSQIEILSDLFKFLSDEHAVDEKIDYNEISKLNTFGILIHYGFIASKNEALKKYCHEKSAGMVIVDDNASQKYFEVIQPVDTFEERADDLKEESLKDGKKRYEKAKKGIIEIEFIGYTEKYYRFINKI